MNRRELLKAIVPLTLTPLVVDGKEVGKSIAIDPAAKYLVFINPHLIDTEFFCSNNTALPEGTAVHAVYLSRDQSIDDAIRIYKVTS